MAFTHLARRFLSSTSKRVPRSISMYVGNPAVSSTISAGGFVPQLQKGGMPTFANVRFADAESLVSRQSLVPPRLQHLFSTTPPPTPTPTPLPPLGHLDTGEEEEIPEADTIEEPILERTKIVVLGGSGFVGSAVCKEALDKGLTVASINRSGPPGGGEAWVKEVEWIRADVLDTASWRHHLSDAAAVVSCVGAFGSNDLMRKVNGSANASAAAAAAEEGVKRFVYISAHDMGLPSFVLRGYFEGKKQAEDAVREHFPYGGVILRPGMIHGSRRVGNINLPLNVIGGPLEMLLKNAKWASDLPIVGPALVPPVKVTTVARAAVRGAIDNAIPPTALGVWEILRFGEH